MTSEDIRKRRLKDLVEELDGFRGRHTELVSVYIPAGFNLFKVVEQINNEKSTAQNIKSKAVRKNVMSALERITQHLKLYKQTPPNGLVVFSGNVSEREGVADVEIYALEPPEPLNQRLYWCDQKFILDPLKDMIREREIFGIVIVDKSEADIGILLGKKVKLLKHLDSLVPGKTEAGGWCVHENTLLQIPDGTVRKIKDIGNDGFFCYDFKKMVHAKGKHSHFFRKTSEKAYEIKTKAPNISITVTPEHKFFVLGNSGFGEKSAEKLEVGDSILISKIILVKKKNFKDEIAKFLDSTNGQNIVSARIASKKPVKPEGFFYDMEIPVYGNFIANGIILHNSQARYARIREGLLNDFMKKVGEVATHQFTEQKDMIGVIVGGPGPVKETFANGDFLRYDFKKKIIATADISYMGEYGLEEAVNKSEEALKEAGVMKEKKLLVRFFGELGKDSGLAIYGLKETIEAVQAGTVEILLVSEHMDWVKARVKCPKCGEEKDVLMTRDKLESLKCPKDNELYEILAEKDLTDEIIRLAESMGTQVEMMSGDTKEGSQLKEMGGIGGIMRYKT